MTWLIAKVRKYRAKELAPRLVGAVIPAGYHCDINSDEMNDVNSFDLTIESVGDGYAVLVYDGYDGITRHLYQGDLDVLADLVTSR